MVRKGMFSSFRKILFGTFQKELLLTKPCRLKFECLEDRRMLATLAVGSGDGAVSVDVDGYGSFGRAVNGTATGDALINYSSTQIGLVYESAVAIGVSSERQFLSEGLIGTSSSLSSVDVEVSPDGSTAAGLLPKT